jgi:hypothetical protein
MNGGPTIGIDSQIPSFMAPTGGRCGETDALMRPRTTASCRRRDPHRPDWVSKINDGDVGCQLPPVRPAMQSSRNDVWHRPETH